VQLLAGSSIPEWTGNKMDPAGLGLTTIVLSLDLSRVLSGCPLRAFAGSVTR
jgi:hypothetical protein